MTTTARDVAREIVTGRTWSKNELIELIAAALSERERWAVERCCAALCIYCARGLPVYQDNSTGGYKLRHTVDHGKFGKSGEPCYAERIRADAARRETP